MDPQNPIYSNLNPSGTFQALGQAMRTRSGDPNQSDPAEAIPGMPPNFGQTTLPHVVTFQGIVSSVARVYRPSDEAIKDSFANARFMRNDPNIMECLEMRRRSTALLDWHIEPQDENDATQKWLAGELTDVLKRTPRFTQFRECLLDALWYGKYAVQMRYRWKSLPGGRRVCIDRWLPVNGDKLVFRYDDGTGEHDEDQVGIRVGAGFTTGDNIAKRWKTDRMNKVEATDWGLAYFLEPWERKLLAIHKHMVEDGEYEEPRNAGRIHGVGIRSRIYWLWYQRQECLAWLMEFLERSAFGIEIWYYPWGSPTARDETRKAAEERIGQGRNIILVPKPMGEEGMSYGVERIEPGMQGAEILKEILSDYFGHAIKRYILGQTLTTEAASTGLGSNLASIHLDTYLQIVKYDALNLEETLTEDVVKPLLEFNFPRYAHLPLSFAIETESPDVEGKLQAWRQAYEMGCRLREKDVLDLIGAMAPEEGEDALQNPQHAQAQQQAATSGMGGMMPGAGAGMPGMDGPGGGDPGGDDPGPFDGGGGGPGSGPPPMPPGPEDYDADGEAIHSRAERRKLMDPEKSSEPIEQYARHKPAKGQAAFAFDDDGPKDPEFESKHPRDPDGKFAEGSGTQGSHKEKPDELFRDRGRKGETAGVPVGKSVGTATGRKSPVEPPGASASDGERLLPLFDRPDQRRPGDVRDPDRGGDGPHGGPRTGDDRDDGGGDRGTRGGSGERAPRVKKPPRPKRDLAAGNYRYTNRDFTAGSLQKKFRRNIDAIKTLKAMRAEGRTAATPDEQETLAKFSGWGQFPQSLWRGYGDWDDEHKELMALLSDEEFEEAKKLSGADARASAQKATLNSHFTSPQIVDAHWKMAQRLGFRGGRMLEPSVGSGYYIGMMPSELAGRTAVTGIELDKTTAAVAKALYPSANIRQEGFEEYKAPDNFYDLVCSNVPFGNYRIHEPRYNKFRASIHDHFFLKSVDKVRPGGLVMHVTSTGTLDKGDARIRQEIAKQCDLVAAIRLPGKTHKGAAGTDVVTDLLILRKRDKHGAAPAETPKEANPDKPGFTGVTTDSLGRVYHWVDGVRVPANRWTETTTVPDPGGGEDIPVSRYFADNPSQILGTLDRTGTMYAGNTMNVTAPDNFDEALQAAIDRLPEGIYRDSGTVASEEEAEALPAGDGVKDGEFTVKDGEVWQRKGDALVKQNLAAQDVARIKAVGDIRTPLRDLMRQDLAGENSAEARKALNEAYDRFVAEHGPLNDKPNLKALATDPDLPLLLSLERWDASKKTATKADIFEKQTIRAKTAVTHVNNAAEGLGVSLNEFGRIDVDHIAKLAGQSVEDVEDDLVESGLAFDDPEAGWTPRALYLSGNVRKKLEMARAAADTDDRYKPNVKALEEHQPEDIEYGEIGAKLGSPWIPGSDIEAFAAHLSNGKPEDFAMQYVPQTAEWTVDYSKRSSRWLQQSSATESWETPRVDFMTLLGHALNGTGPKVYDTDPDGNRMLNREATEQAQHKVQEMKDEFGDWLWSDDERRERLHRYYNDNFNNIREVEYDGSHLTYPGMNPAFKLRDVQNNFVWQVVTRGKGLLAHEVGVGKTSTMVAAAMELRRLGLAKKPAIACKKSNLEQLTRAAQDLYPGAKIISTSGQFGAKERKEMVSRIATGDFDMVFLSHEHLDLLDMSPEVQAGYIRDEVDELSAAIESAKEVDSEGKGSKKSRTVKQLEKRKAKLEASLREAIGKKKDDAVTFEETGIDFLFVDEAHRYKSLPVYTKHGDLAGVPQGRSDRATTMLMKSRWLQEQNGGRGLVFATGTPVSNTMAELYNMQRFIQPEELKERGLSQFDAWADTFGETVSALEPDLKGGYKVKARFSRFVNIPELMQIARQDMDVRRVDQLGKNPDGSPVVKRPNRLEHVVIAPQSEGVKAMMADIQSRAQAIQGKRAEKGEDNPLSLTTLGRQGSVDLRLHDADAPDDPGSKLNMMVKNVLDRYHSAEHTGQTQLVFSDIGVHPTSGGFRLYDEVIRKLVAGGIPRDEIADFGKLDGKKRVEAAAKLKAGKMRIGIGSTEKMGTGLNIQTHIGAMHHLDIPYKPSAIEQRDGRGHRFGNRNKDVDIFRYVTEGSLDEMSWGIVSRKAAFISQAITDPKAGQRSIDDEDTEALTPQQLMAAASGDTRALDRVNLQRTLKQLRGQKGRHEREQVSLKQRIEKATQTAADLDAKAGRMRSDAEHLAGHREFSLTVGQNRYKDRKEADEALVVRAQAIDAEAKQLPAWRQYNLEPEPVGQYRGMGLTRHKGQFHLTGPSGEVYTTGDSLGSIEAVARRIQKNAEQATEDAAKTRQDVETIRHQVGKPFRRDEELRKVEEELRALETSMRTGSKSEKPAEQRDEGPMLFASETARLRYHLDAECCRRGLGNPFNVEQSARLSRWLTSGIGGQIEVPDRFGQVYRYSRSRGNLSVEKFQARVPKGSK